MPFLFLMIFYFRVLFAMRILFCYLLIKLIAALMTDFVYRINVFLNV